MICKTGCKGCGCLSSRRSATAHSTKHRCGGSSGTMRAGPIDGLILAATSGEGMSLGAHELERLVTLTRSEMSACGRHLPVCLGLSGASTARMMDALDETAAWPIDGYLIASPYYTRPSQRGLVQHFETLADHASWPIVLYNIPYRTAVNLTNETLLRLAAHPNIVGIKDCSADRAQSVEFLKRRPAGVSRADRRGRQLSRGAHRRRRRRDPALGASGDRQPSPRCGRCLRRATSPARRRAGMAYRTDAAVVRGAEPGAGEVLAGAQRADRQRRGSPANGGSEHGSRSAARCRVRAPKPAATCGARECVASLPLAATAGGEAASAHQQAIGQHRREAEHHRPDGE